MSRPLVFLLPLLFATAASADTAVSIDPALQAQVIEWRRDLH